MRIHLVGCSHHESSLDIREKLSFSPDQVRHALTQFRKTYPSSEAVLLSTCNRTELYAAASDIETLPSHAQMIDFLGDFHGLNNESLKNELFQYDGERVVKHLFTVAASLDSMVVGEAQILSQVKQAYETAVEFNRSMPYSHSVFQSALRVAKKVASQTTIHEKRVSVPSVAVSEFAKGIFETFEDKRTLVIGAGEMALETISYLKSEGCRDFLVVNRSQSKAEAIAKETGGEFRKFEDLINLLPDVDLVVSTTGAEQPIVTLDEFSSIEKQRQQRTLFVIDLAVPRDFEPSIGDCLNVYLYSIDDFRTVCDANRKARQDQWPLAEKIIDQQTQEFLSEINHRATGPTIKRLKEQADVIKANEVERLFNKLETLDEKERKEINNSFNRLVNKILHPPLESLKDDTSSGSKHGLLDAIRKLFQIGD